MLTYLLTALALIPLAGLLASLLVPRHYERAIFAVAMTAIGAELVVFAVLLVGWLAGGMEPVLASSAGLQLGEHYTFAFHLYFDLLSAVFLGVSTLVTALVFAFSRFYLHREPGFKRFYYTVLFFVVGLMLVILAGNFETLLVGWEFIGMSSVLLIAFYRDRFLPARNALKVFSIYRIADACLLAAIWYAHHAFERSIDFSEFATVAAQHGDQLAVLGILILVVAPIKSAQFPVSYWLPRAMEGPTSSSAIFYGALSVHMGLFLLIRTYPLWEGNIWLHIAVGVVGLVTAVVATSIARVQSSIKTQIAYASITQIGIMFVEVALGLWWLALIHFVSNALLRTYQLLISPSIVGYLVHEQFLTFTPPRQRIDSTLLGRLRATSYVLGVKEWNMNSAANRVLWKPLKAVGRLLSPLDAGVVQIGSVLLALVGAALVGPSQYLAAAAVTLSFLIYVRAYTTKHSAVTAWNLIMLGQFYTAVFFVSLGQQAGLYLAGVGVAYCVGHVVLARIADVSLARYHGMMVVHKRLGYVFFVACLFVMAFPISPTFVMQDMLLSLIPMEQAILLVLFCASYLLLGISTMRLYTKVFYGAHASKHHERAYKSS